MNPRLILIKAFSTLFNITTLILLGYIDQNILTNYVFLIALSVVATSIVDLGENSLNGVRHIDDNDWVSVMQLSWMTRIALNIFSFALIILLFNFYSTAGIPFVFIFALFSTLLANRLRTVLWRDGKIISAYFYGEFLQALIRLIVLVITFVFFHSPSILLIFFSSWIISVIVCIFILKHSFIAMQFPLRLDKLHLTKKNYFALPTFFSSYLTSISIAFRDQALSLFVLQVDEMKQISLVIFSRLQTIGSVIFAGFINKIHLLLDKNSKDSSRSLAYAARLSLFFIIFFNSINILYLHVIHAYPSLFNQKVNWNLFDGIVGSLSFVLMPLCMYAIASGRFYIVYLSCMFVFFSNLWWWY